MTAFEQAWDLLKMPLDLDSVKVLPADEVADLHATADFIHPKTGKRFPMKVRGNDGQHDVWIEGPGEQDETVARASTGPVQLETPSVKEWLMEYGGIPADQWTIERLIEEDKENIGHHRKEDYRGSIRDLFEMMGGRPYGRGDDGVDDDLERRFLRNRLHTGDELSVDRNFQRIGMGSALYDLLTELGVNVNPSVNQDLRGRLMWLKNQGITDHRFAPPYEYPDDLPRGQGGKRRGDIEYDFARLADEQPPYWRGLRERRRLGI